MARKLRLQYEGAIYHVAVRGNRRRRIFCDDRDRDRLLWRLCESKEAYDVRVYVYCLMDNHFHLLVETPRANISQFMHSALTGYSVYFNLRHNTSGHLQQGRFGSQLVQGDEYLLSVSRYIHLNPVHVKSIEKYSPSQKAQYLRAYRWSSYRGYIDPRKRNELVEYGPVLSLTGGRKGEKESRYEDFVKSGLVETDKEFLKLMKAERRGIGSREFRVWVDGEYRKLKGGMGSPEDVSFRHERELVEPAEVLDVVAKAFKVKKDALKRRARNSVVRPVAAKMLCKYSGLTQRAAGKLLGYGTGAAVSMQMKRLRRELAEPGSALPRQLARIEKQLKAQRPR